MATSTSFPDDMHLTDTISLTNLQLPHPVLAPDVWGVPKAQPALVNLTLQLRAPFHTAADGDALDGSTMHYGMLAKRIRSACGEGGDGREVTRKVAECVDELGRGKEEEGRPRGNVVRSARVEVRFPKAGMYGELGVMMAETWAWGKEGGDGRREVMMVGLPDVKVMTLVGVNACERTARQPVMVGLWVRGVVEGDGLRGWAATFRMERVLVQIIEATSFETLESLAEHTVKLLREQLLDEAMPGGRVRLRLSKPRAIVFADAPAVEIVREIPGK